MVFASYSCGDHSSICYTVPSLCFVWLKLMPSQGVVALPFDPARKFPELLSLLEVGCIPHSCLKIILVISVNMLV